MPVQTNRGPVESYRGPVQTNRVPVEAEMIPGRIIQGAGRDERGASRNGHGAGRDERGASRNGHGAGRNERGASRNTRGICWNKHGVRPNTTGSGYSHTMTLSHTTPRPVLDDDPVGPVPRASVCHHPDRVRPYPGVVFATTITSFSNASITGGYFSNRQPKPRHTEPKHSHTEPSTCAEQTNTHLRTDTRTRTPAHTHAYEQRDCTAPPRTAVSLSPPAPGTGVAAEARGPGCWSSDSISRPEREINFFATVLSASRPYGRVHGATRSSVRRRRAGR